MKSTIGMEIRDQILDATEEIVNQHGVGRLTLDAVAKHVGLSKSGLLHYFPHKDLLVDAVMSRTVSQWQVSLDQAMSVQGEGRMRTARALLHCCLGDISEWNERLRRSSTAILAVLVHCPTKRTPLHEFYERLQTRMKEESHGVPTGELILTVIDGIWLRWVTGLAPIDDLQVIGIRGLLNQLLESEPDAT